MTTALSDPLPWNFVAHLQQLAAQRADDVALIVVADGRNGEVVERALSYGRFEERVRALAVQLQTQLEPNDRALILLDNDEHYAISMLACFYAGVIAVPVFRPESMRPQLLARLSSIADDAQAAGALVLSADRESLAARFAGSTLITVDTIDESLACHWMEHAPAPDDIAFLQYTSGSTAEPKGVMVSHANLFANECAMADSMSIGRDDKFGVWSPLFHDMGLIGGLLQPIFSGIPCVLTSPRFFLERPLRWLELISRHRVTVSGGPDFAYRLCVERIKGAPAIDLSSWRLAYTGAEPVRHDTMAAFIERFGTCGFRAAAIYPCYGLAEATLFVAGGLHTTGMELNRFSAARLAARHATQTIDGTALVACGRAASGHELRIVDPEQGDEVPDGRLGEVWAAGPSIALGYWDKPRETAQTFVQRDGRCWLRTGDLGFVHEGQIYLAGRIKDMIIVRGQNVYPQDIERAVEGDVEAVRKGRVAAFAIDIDGRESIGVAAEVSRAMQKRLTPQSLVDAISQAVNAQSGEAPQAIVLLNPGALPKTSSGKLQRSACRAGWRKRSLDAYALYEQGCFVIGHESAEVLPREDEIESVLAQLWRDVLGHDAARRYPADAHFFSLGGNSLAAVQLISRIAEQWHIDMPLSWVLGQPHFQSLAHAIRGAVNGADRTLQPTIPRLTDEQRAQPQLLSHAQERQWFSWQLDASSSAYHVALVLHITGLIDIDALHLALNEVIERHDVLRTVFRGTADGSAVQQLRTAPSLQIVSRDLRNEPDESRARRAAEYAQWLQREPFDLTNGPLLRLALLRLDDDMQRLVIVVHHIVSDGVSVQVLLQELAKCYASQVQGARPQLAAPDLKYAEYASWQRSWLAGGEGARQLQWWRDQLGDVQPVLALQTDHPRKPQASYRAARHSFEISDDLLVSLRLRAHVQGTTLFTMLLSALRVLLYRYTGQQDIRIGVPVANRHHAAIANVIGLFVNMLVVRGRIHGGVTVGEVATQAQTALVGAQMHQDLPFEQLVRELQPQRSLSHSPLVQVTLNHLQADYRTIERDLGVKLLAHEVLHQATHFDLTFEITELAAGAMQSCIVYCEELFKPATIAGLARHYLAALSAVAEQPETKVRDVLLLDESERDCMLQRAGRECMLAAPPLAHQLFERHVVITPDALAVAKGDVSMSYGELNRAANSLALRMIRLGIGPERRVGIAVERSIEMIVCLLATLKAGAAYVPLDCSYPQERLAHMLRDSGIALLLTQRSLQWRIPVDTVPVLYVEELPPDDADAATNPNVPLHEQNLAYVIYTSGSTGTPKGVAVAHGPLARHLQSIGEIYAVDATHRELFFFSLSFDAAVEQWLTPLCGGGAVILSDPHQLAADSFVELIAKHGITTLHVPPAYLRVIAACAAKAGIRIRTCIVGAEALTWADCELARRAFGSPSIVNAYGPTEAIITPTAWVCDPGTPIVGGNAPIGYPVAGRRVYVLDEDLNLVPGGVTGELYVGGFEIARGYANRAALTAERFIADPFDAEGGRLYRTGDRVRWHAQGHLEYLGRADQQVKVRGFRIELGEIEAQLRAQPGVREAVAVARVEGENERIDAYICGDELDTGELRRALRERLPDYMAPNAMVVLERLPLTPNGKVDREALPKPSRDPEPGGAAPCNSLEEKLAAIWADVLATPQIARHDNFFELGGDSLTLIKVHSCIKERFWMQLSLVDLFEHTTIATLAAFLERRAEPAAPAERAIQERAALQRSHFIRRPAPAVREPI